MNENETVSNEEAMAKKIKRPYVTPRKSAVPAPREICNHG